MIYIHNNVNPISLWWALLFNVLSLRTSCSSFCSYCISIVVSCPQSCSQSIDFILCFSVSLHSALASMIFRQFCFYVTLLVFHIHTATLKVCSNFSHATASTLLSLRLSPIISHCKLNTIFTLTTCSVPSSVCCWKLYLGPLIYLHLFSLEFRI